MGCDIHMSVEKLVDGRWCWVKPPITEERYWNNGPFKRREYRTRNYDLFAILADVRNGRGFADHMTGTGFEPISEPRGLPPDVSPLVRRRSDKRGVDGHSHSWLLLSEVLPDSPIWEKETTHITIIGLREYVEYKKTGEMPEFGYFSWDTESGVKLIGEKAVTPEFLERVLTPELLKQAAVHDKYRVIVQTKELYKDCIVEDWWEFLDYAKTLGAPDGVRLVFWFDN